MWGCFREYDERSKPLVPEIEMFLPCPMSRVGCADQDRPLRVPVRTFSAATNKGTAVQQIHNGGTTTFETMITGATGFVGGELLIKLLKDSNKQLICPVRAGSSAAAQERGEKRLNELAGEDADRYRKRVRWLRADIEEPHLGWNDATWHDVAMATNEIFHCAASVSFDLPLDEAHRINVVGTEHVHQVAMAAAERHGQFTRFHHVSTAYVAGLAKGRVNSDYLPPDRTSSFRNSYEQTKARAERYLRSHASTRVPVTIHRPSIIAGDSVTGATTNWNVLYVPMKMVARGVLPAFAFGGRQLVDCIAIDVLVDAMAIFSQLDAKALHTHHVTAGPKAITATDVIRRTSEQAGLHPAFEPSDTKMLGPARWRCLTATVAMMARLPKRAGSVRTKARIARRCIDQCAVYLPYARVNTIFDATRDHDVLRVFGVEMPPGSEYLDTIMAFALDTNFGKDAAPTSEGAIA